MGAKSNWWSPGENGPCGPDTEMFYDLKGDLNLTSKEEFLKADKDQSVVEIWNDVFMEYEKKDGKIIGKLEKQNVDTGSGFERVTTVLQNKSNVFETDIFENIIEEVEKVSDNERSKRIISDHIRASVFIISAGIEPSNTDQGYILRRLIRRAIFNTSNKKLNPEEISDLVDVVSESYKDIYYELEDRKEKIKETIKKESDQFEKTLKDGLKQFEKLIKDKEINGKDAFILFSTYGFPFELTKEMSEEKGIKINEKEFEEEFKKHQEKSRTSTSGKFKGGLASTGEIEIKYHTATHLLHAALKSVLGDHVNQKGSNITAQRLRFDFSHPKKMTDEEKEKVEKWINDAIDQDLEVKKEEMSYDEAKELGITGLFEEKYGDKVSTYSIGRDGDFISREMCGGPHVERIGALGKFRIKKEEASSAGVRRIKAVLE
jgi:alanyl-tRNA synthetase